MNQCTHNIDLLRWVMGGEIDEVIGLTDNLKACVSNFVQYTIKLRSVKAENVMLAKFKSEDIHSIIYYLKPMHRKDVFSNIKYN